MPNVEIGRKVKIGTVSEIEGGTADEVEVVWVLEDKIVINQAIDVATGDLIVDNRAYEAGAGWKWFNSLEWITDDGTDYGNTFQGKDRSTSYLLQGNRLAGTSNVLTDIDKALRKISVGGKTKNVLVVCGLDKYDEIVGKLQANRTITTNGVKDLDLIWGYRGVSYVYNGKTVNIVPHELAKKDRIYVYDTSALGKVILTDNTFMDDAGSYLVQSWIGYYTITRMYANVVAFQPRKTAKIVY